MPGGRPSVYNEEIAAEICRRLADGETLRAICRRPEMPAISSVLLWVVDGKHKEFSEQYRIAREAQGHFYADSMLVTVEELMAGGIAHQEAKVIVDTYKWVAERNAPKAYGQKSQVDNISSDGSMSVSGSSVSEAIARKYASDN